MRAWLIALTFSLVVLTGCSEQPLGAGHYRWEGIDGFAIWPEDQPQDALAWCEIAEGDPWWRDPASTAEEFARSKLGWSDPSDLTGREVPEDAPRAVFSVTDGSMSRHALGVVVHLRQLRGCWFVAAVWPREGDLAGTYDWVSKDGRWVLRASSQAGDDINLEVGWGDTVKRVELGSGEEVEIPTPDPHMSGHILWFHDEPSEHTFGQPLSPPPHIP